MPSKDVDLLTVNQVAELAKVSRGAVLNWHRTGKLKRAVKESGRPRFTRGAVMALITGTCPVCGTGFRRANLRQEYCGQRCRHKAAELGIRTGDKVRDRVRESIRAAEHQSEKPRPMFASSVEIPAEPIAPVRADGTIDPAALERIHEEHQRAMRAADEVMRRSTGGKVQSPGAE